MQILQILVIVCASFLELVRGHGRLMDPPARNSMWRFGFPNPVNYNDNELYCGGYSVQWEQNGGKCGICGDAYHLEEPRPHEAGGLYAKGIVARHYRYQVRLPPYLTCTQCVMRWVYYTGNQWGVCDNGTHAVGCGKSETFINCADVAVTTNAGGAIPPLFINQDNPYLLYYQDLRYSAPYNVFPLVIREQVCVPKKLYRMIPGVDEWCQKNCLRYPPNCPTEICECPTTCEAVGDFEGETGADVYCMDQCLVYPATGCPRKQCSCHEEKPLDNLVF
ncbi:uncharacterized protein LOC115886703 isoform X2 [Sitophilus oryzae]|uniref:Uncharacterized protein LOC115886703 isoform X2 n=1 Tax=Sitophilus oryzae TaxID=7048 RepID=A0A6J2YER2_SITOR|nr:uncharacterized protein LOC115886703 isoform X2 [Sitophilus oryzae]